MANVLVTIRTVDDQVVPVAIDGVLVRVYDDTDTYITEGLTGAGATPGEVEFTLNGDAVGVPYRLRLHKDDVSFPPAPTFDIAVLDPPDLSNNTFEFTGHIGATAVLATLVVKDEVDNPLEGILIRLFDETEVLMAEALTDTNGELVLALEGLPDPGKTYLVRLSTPGRVVEGGPTQQIQVLDPIILPATNIFDFVASQPALPSSTDANMCLMSGFFVDTANRPLSKVRIRCIPLYTDPDPRPSGFPGAGTVAIIGRNQIIREAVFETDEDGYVEVVLPRGSIHEVHIHGYEIPGFPTIAPIYVPDALSAKLEDVFFPYISSVDFDLSTISFVTGDVQQIVPSLLNSDTRDMSDSLRLLEYSSSDEDVATVSFDDSGNLVVTAIGVGTATILVERTADSFVARLPSIPELEVMPVSIEVTA